MKGKTLWGLVILAFVMLPLAAQLNEILDNIYQSEQVDRDEGIWLVLTGAEILPEDSQVDQARVWAETNLPKYDSGQEYLTQGQLALVLMETYPLPRGVMYRLTKSPRYALRDLQYLNIIPANARVDQGLSGFDLVNSLGEVMEGAAQ